MTEADRQLWEAMLAYLRKAHPTICRQWFEDLEPLGVSAGALNIRAHSVLHRDYLAKMCREAFNDAMVSSSGRLMSVRFLGPQDDPPAIVEGTEGPRRAAAGRQAGAPAWRPPVGDDAAAGGRDGRAAGATVPAAVGVTSDGASNGASGGPSGGPSGGHSGTGAVVRGSEGSRGRGESPVVVEPSWSRTAERQVPGNAIGHGGGAGSFGGGGHSVAAGFDRVGYESLVVNPDYGFEHFVVGPENRLAHAAAVAVAENPGRAYNPYFIHGGVGLGKTHLLQAICLQMEANKPGLRMYYTSCEGFVTHFMDSVQSGKMAEFRHRFRDVDVLVIDDIHYLAKRDRTQEEFFHTFNSLYQAQRQIILSSDAAPQEIPDLEERLVSRFKWGLVCKIDPPRFETRAEIVKRKARLRGLTLGEGVAELIAGRIDANIRELEGAIVKLQMMASVDNRPIDVSLTREALGDVMPTASREPSIQSIMTTVCEFYGVRVPDVQGERRHRSIALPRQVSMFLARDLTRMSLEEIGGYFGNRDHTTVMHAVDSIKTKRKADPMLDETLKAMADRLSGGAGAIGGGSTAS